MGTNHNTSTEQDSTTRPAVFPVHEFDGIDLAFPTKTKGLMPEYAEIPKEFKAGRTKWNQLFADCFYSGLKSLELTPKEGIDKNKAWAHIRYIMGSWEPKHEHKEAAVAYLLSQWFEDAKWEKADRK
jgi:hypothetical protein